MKDNPNKRHQGNRPNDPNNDNKDDFQWRKGSRSIIFWVILFFGIGFFAYLFPPGGKSSVEIDYSAYLKHLENGEIIKGEVIVKKEANEFLGTLSDFAYKDVGGGKQTKYNYFKTTLPYLDKEMVEDWRKRGIEIEFSEDSAEWLELVGGFLPWVLLLGIWIFIFRRMQGGGTGKNIFSFGKSRARLLMENETRVTFDDVAGCDEAKEELQEIPEEPRQVQPAGR